MRSPDYVGPVPLPKKPLSTPPRSWKKVLALAERYRRGQSLFHPADAPLDEREGLAAEATGNGMPIEYVRAVVAETANGREVVEECPARSKVQKHSQRYKTKRPPTKAREAARKRRSRAVVRAIRIRRMSKKLVSWTVTLPDGRVYYAEANTKSEARGKVKKRLGLQRLPPGTKVWRAEEIERVAAATA